MYLSLCDYVTIWISVHNNVNKCILIYMGKCKIFGATKIIHPQKISRNATFRENNVIPGPISMETR